MLKNANMVLEMQLARPPGYIKMILEGAKGV